MKTADIVVVGSGPTGIAATTALVEAGAEVVLLDAGDGLTQDEHHLPDRPFLTSRREESEQWRWLLGSHFEALSAPATASPKLRAAVHRSAVTRELPATSVVTDNFTALFSLATGGMSTAWGAGVSCFTDEDLAGCPVRETDLEPGYRRLALDVGISGVGDDDLADFHGCQVPLQVPPALAPQAEKVLRSYGKRSRRLTTSEFRLGHARNAVLTSAGDPSTDRVACTNLALCLWGCPNRSIYSSVYELRRLAASGLDFRPGHRVDHLRRQAGGIQIEGHLAGESEAFGLVAQQVVLACGPPISARLVLEALGIFDTPVPFETAPAIGFAALVPSLLGRAPSAEAFGLSQLSFMQRLSETKGDYAYGNLFGTDGILHTDVAPYIPLRLTAARRILRILMPSMLLGNCFLPGSYSRNTLHVSADSALHFRGAHSEDLPDVVRRFRRELRSQLARCGALLLPGGFQLTRPGDDIHLGAILPMRAEPEPWQCTADGEVAGLPGVYVADAASLPRIPARPHTFTAMANARRIAQKLAG